MEGVAINDDEDGKDDDDDDDIATKMQSLKTWHNTSENTTVRGKLGGKT